MQQHRYDICIYRTEVQQVFCRIMLMLTADNELKMSMELTRFM